MPIDAMCRGVPSESNVPVRHYINCESAGCAVEQHEASICFLDNELNLASATEAAPVFWPSPVAAYRQGPCYGFRGRLWVWGGGRLLQELGWRRMGHSSRSSGGPDREGGKPAQPEREWEQQHLCPRILDGPVHASSIACVSLLPDSCSSSSNCLKRSVSSRHSRLRRLYSSFSS
ncbi:hypothetical protein DPEC_G00057860 [Dallia pectoralis]|uniref:Uncharacterized protein n=1 Tax=Dallia pectoralis TaxID=75939 RepID=A0ACC2H6W7_DALPE|nr:hypothetical protein DPEC_G00057860 [Dallia pectoralis]